MQETKYVELYWQQPVRPASQEQDELEYRMALELDADVATWARCQQVAAHVGSVLLAAALCYVGVQASPYLPAVRAMVTGAVTMLVRHGSTVLTMVS